jgi:TRAP-type C4-dicarboxylate transport system permease small subunit
MALASVRRAVFIVFETIAIAAFLIMLGSSILQVIFRYLSDISLMWTEELARLMCVLTTYFGGVVVLMLREHIRVDAIDSLVGPRGRALAAIVSDALVAWFLIVFAVGCWLMARATWETETATMDWFRMGYIYAAVGVAVVAMIAIVALDATVRIMGFLRRRAAAR